MKCDKIEAAAQDWRPGGGQSPPASEAYGGGCGGLERGRWGALPARTLLSNPKNKKGYPRIWIPWNLSAFPLQYEPNHGQVPHRHGRLEL